MYQTIREYHANPQSTDEILKKVEQSLLPLISQAPGFRDYTCFDGGNGTVTSVSIFETRADGDRFNSVAHTWVHENLSSLLPNEPRITSGEVRAHATGKILVTA